MDEYYTLTFFGFADCGPYIIADLQPFMCPEHYDQIEDAQFVASYWMRYGFFRSVRCDRHCEPFTGVEQDRFRTEYGVFYAQKLDGRVVWKNSDGTVTWSELSGRIKWKWER